MLMGYSLDSLQGRREIREGGVDVVQIGVSG